MRISSRRLRFRAPNVQRAGEISVTMQRKRKKRWWLWGGIPALVLIALIAAVAVARGSGSKIDPGKLAKATRGDIAKSVVATGKIQPITKVELKSKASGIVEKLYVDINQHVHKGQVLAQLDQQEILAQVAAQKATLAAAAANVITFKANIDQDKVTAEAPDLPMYQTTYERNLAMSKDGIVSKQTLDDAQRNYVAAANKRDGSVAQISVDRAKLKQAEAQVEQAQASLDQLNEQLSYTTLVSPMDGVVLSRDVEMGDAVSSILVLGSTATLVMTLGDTTQVYVQGKMDEADIGSVYLGQPARIRVESFPNKSFNGKVTKIAPLGVEKDNVTTFEVRVSIDNPTGELKTNMTANAEVLITEHKNSLTVPEQALVYDNQKNASIFVPDPKQKDGQRKIAVKAGISNGSKTEILDGLKEGDTVVLQQ